MDGVFVREEDRSDITFYIRIKGDSIKLLNPNEYSKLRTMEKPEYEENHVQIRPLTWAKSNQVQGLARVIDSKTGMRVFDSELFIQAKLKAIIASWSFKVKNIKGEDVPVPVNSDNIDALHPIVANHIINQYSERYEMSEETRKNS